MCEVKNPYFVWDTTRPLFPTVKEDTKYNKFYNDEWKITATLCFVVLVPEIERVIFNGPATIVFWNDGTKTVVKCMEGELFDEEKGIAMAFMKKLYGKGYMNKIRNHIPAKIYRCSRGRENVEN